MVELMLFRSASAAGEAIDIEGARLSLEVVTEDPAPGIEQATRELYPDTRTLLDAVRVLLVGPGSEVVQGPRRGARRTARPRTRSPTPSPWPPVPMW